AFGLRTHTNPIPPCDPSLLPLQIPALRTRSARTCPTNGEPELCEHRLWGFDIRKSPTPSPRDTVHRFVGQVLVSPSSPVCVGFRGPRHRQEFSRMAAGRGRPVWQKHFLLPLNGFAFLGVDLRHDFTPPAACVHIERLSGLNLSLVGHPRDRGLTPG